MEIKDLMSKAAENLSVGRSFGAAYEKNGLLVVPVALVCGGGGGGEGPAFPPSAPRTGERSAEAGNGAVQGAANSLPEGSGGGFGGLVLPVGAYVVKGDDVRWVPAVDVTLVALAALSVLRLLVRWRTRVRLHQHA